MDINNLSNDNIRSIFDYLSIPNIINYCNSNKSYNQICNTQSFRNYFITNYFNDRINDERLYNIPVNQLLLEAYVDNESPTNILKGRSSMVLKDMLITKYIGNAPNLNRLSRYELSFLLDILYPDSDNDEYYKSMFNKNKVLDIMTERLRTAFRLKYDVNKIRKLFDNIGHQISKTINKTDYIKSLCIRFDRKDIYRNIFETEPSVEYRKDYNIIKNKGLRANYLTYTNDEIENLRVDEYYLSYSDNPILLFNKYRDHFMQNEQFRMGYEGISATTDSNEIGYIMGSHTNKYVNDSALKLLTIKVADSIDSSRIDKNNLKALVLRKVHPMYLNKLLNFIINDTKLYMESIKNVETQGYLGNILESIGSNYYGLVTCHLHKFLNRKDDENDVVRLKDIIQAYYNKF